MVSAMTADCKLTFGPDKSHENPGAQEDRPMTSFLGMRGARTVICLIQAFGEFIHVPRPFIHVPRPYSHRVLVEAQKSSS